MGETTPIRRAAGWAARLVLTVVAGFVTLGVLLAVYAGVVYLRLPSVGAVGDEGDPGHTPFMRADACPDRRVSYRPLDQIDPRLACAVVWAEDRTFFYHDGVDVEAFERAMEANWDAGELKFGGSTIAMQLARNLFLSRDRTPTRKLQEVVLARRLVARYDRLRVLELYLNTAEWAPCVYGAEAAANHYFGHGADLLDGAEATFLAAMLPRPSHPPDRETDRAPIESRQQVLLTLLMRARLLARAEVEEERREVRALWAGFADHRPRSSAPAPQQWLEQACGSRPSGTLPPSN